ncbi:hypothetical protein ASPCAL04221 [Aspergillus calidoustus]|uniref:Uncharacterized protein n=1 Tax=Aspergillus calidoustus TaxID=454130 RepID=A0A0U5FWH0_ASPCI|nr:hypothetical protein ASPCAL04221 [Aspergillus calidoustus]
MHMTSGNNWNILRTSFWALCLQVILINLRSLPLNIISLIYLMIQIDTTLYLLRPDSIRRYAAGFRDWTGNEGMWVVHECGDEE